MLYLLDANVLIDANRDYYPIDRVPEFWDWLAAMGERGLVKIPLDIYEEIVNPPPERQDAVVDWLRTNRDALLLAEEARRDLVALVTEQGYVNGPTDVDIEKIGRDPFLIAYALTDPADRSVISNETSRPSKRGSNRKVPDVCDDFNVRHSNIFEFIRELDFRTDWRTRR